MVEYLSGGRIQGLNNVFTAWDITDSAYADKSFSVSSYFAELGGIAFKTDGTKMYVSDYAADTVSEFTLSTAWDITTSTYVAQHSFTSTDNALTGVFFKSDGTKIFVVGLQNDTVYEFPLSSAWDITSVGTLTDSHSISTQETNPYQLFFKPDGLTMYVIGGSNSVNQYTLGSAWDLSGTVTHYKTFSVSSQDTGMIGLQFSSDGTKMFTAGYTNDKLYQYTLGTAWDLNGTVTYDSAATFTPTESETHPCGIFFNSNGGEFFILGTGQDTVYQYHTKITDEKSSITNVPANTRYEETDTRKIYRMVGDTIATLNHNFASGLSPLTVNSFSSSYISATGGILDCNFPYTTGNSQTNYGVSARYDFGADTVSETNWVIRWKAKCNSFENSGVQFQVGLTDGDDSVYSTATQTSIACLWQQNSSVSLAQGNASSNGLNGSDRTATGYGLSNSTYYYFEMKRLNATSIGLKVGTSAYGGTEKGNITHTTSSAVDDLRYLTFTKDGRACTADVDEVIFLNNTTSGTVKEWKERNTA